MLSIFNNKYLKPVVPFLKHNAFTYIPNPNMVILKFSEIVFLLKEVVAYHHGSVV